MNFLKRVLGKQNAGPSADEINKILIPFRDSICNFKDKTNISWTIILPAVMKEACRLTLAIHNPRDAKQFFLRPQITQYVSRRVPLSAVVGLTVPSAQPEEMQAVDQLVRKLSSILLGESKSLDVVASALSIFALSAASRVVDDVYASSILKVAIEEIDSLTGS